LEARNIEQTADRNPGQSYLNAEEIIGCKCMPDEMEMDMEDPRCKIAAMEMEDLRCRNTVDAVVICMEDLRCQCLRDHIVIEMEDCRCRSERTEMEDARCQGLRNW
jgi:hypothetical protein